MTMKRRNLLWTLLVVTLHCFTANAFSSSLVDVPKPTVSSVTLLPRPCRTNAWNQLVPPTNLLQPFQKQNGCDVTVQWTEGDNLAEVAAALLEPTPSQDPILQDYLTNCLQEFQSFCQQHLKVDGGGGDNNIQGFKARIVATRGAVKCPRWHLDHVPVRWIQSLVGPGCEYVVDQEYSEELKDFLNSDSNRQDGKKIETRRAKPQEVALLVGNRWNEFAQQPEPHIPPVLHKSPELSVWEGRVLLTMDVVVPYHNDE